MSFQVQNGTIRCVDTIRCEFQHRIRSASGQSGASFRGKSGVLQGIQSAVSFKVKLGVFRGNESGLFQGRFVCVSGRIRCVTRGHPVCYKAKACVLNNQVCVSLRAESGAFQNRIRGVSRQNQVF